MIDCSLPLKKLDEKYGIYHYEGGFSVLVPTPYEIHIEQGEEKDVYSVWLIVNKTYRPELFFKTEGVTILHTIEDYSGAGS